MTTKNSPWNGALAGAEILAECARDVADLVWPNGWRAVDVLLRSVCHLVFAGDNACKNGNMMIVSALHSDHTIFASAGDNHAFRAWHDWHRYKLRAELNREGELAVHDAMKADLAVFLRHSKASFIDQQRAWALLACENIGQLEHWERLGSPPSDQRTFALGYLAARGLL